MYRYLIIACALTVISFKGEAQTSGQKIIAFVDQNMDQKVGRGECWDLAAQAIQYAGCEMKTTYDFGRIIDRTSEKLKPGDILQIENVVLRYKRRDTFFVENMAKHTAIVYKVTGPETIVMAEQNGSAGRIVSLAKLNFSHIVQGRITCFRPECD